MADKSIATPAHVCDVWLLSGISSPDINFIDFNLVNGFLYGSSRRGGTMSSKVTTVNSFSKASPSKYQQCYRYDMRRIRDVKQYLRRCDRRAVYLGTAPWAAKPSTLRRSDYSRQATELRNQTGTGTEFLLKVLLKGLCRATINPCVRCLLPGTSSPPVPLRRSALIRGASVLS